MGTALPGPAAEGSLTAAVAGEPVGAKQAGEGGVPVGHPTGCGEGGLGPEEPIAGCPELAAVTPTRTVYARHAAGRLCLRTMEWSGL